MRFLDRFKRKTATSTQTQQRLEPIALGGGNFTAWGGDSYADDVFRGAVDAIARNAAKLEARHVVAASDGTSKAGDEDLNRLLQVRPNPLMSAADFQAKMTTRLYLHGNAFALVDREGRKVRGIYPIDATSARFLQDPTGTIYAEFRTINGQEFTFPYSDVIHLRRHFNADPLLGTPNDAIASTLALSHAMNEGAISAIQAGAQIRGILKNTSILAPQKLAAMREQFIEQFMGLGNSGGVIVLDEKSEYSPIDSKPCLLDADQMDQVKKRIYSYLGVSEGIVSSDFTEEEYGAFYEGTLEPLALMTAQELTSKIFSEREQAFGNSVTVDAGRLQYATAATKAQTIAQLLPYGVLTLNQCLEMLNLPAVPDGDKRLQTLNVVDASKANQYQGVSGGAE